MGKEETAGAGGLGEAANRAAKRETTQTSSFTSPDARGNGLKAKAGTSAAGGGKLLVGREPRHWGRWLRQAAAPHC